MMNVLKYLVSKLARKFKPKANVHGWFGNYYSWQEAQDKCGGYDKQNILNKVKDGLTKVKLGKAAYERDSVAFEKLEYSEDLLAILNTVCIDNKLRLIDFGGSLGSLYFQYRTLLNIPSISWTVVEQQHFVNCGNSYFKNQQLDFKLTIEDALKNKHANTLLLGSVLPYLNEPYSWLSNFMDYGFDYIVIDRTAFIDDSNERLTVQIVPDFIYKASYPAWFFNEKKFIAHIVSDSRALSNNLNSADKSSSTKRNYTYSLEREFYSPFSHEVLLEDGKRAYWKGFLFKRIDIK